MPPSFSLCKLCTSPVVLRASFVPPPSVHAVLPPRCTPCARYVQRMSNPPACPLAPNLAARALCKFCGPTPSASSVIPPKCMLCVQDFCPTVHTLHPPPPPRAYSVQALCPLSACPVQALCPSLPTPSCIPCDLIILPYCTPYARFVHPPGNVLCPMQTLWYPPRVHDALQTNFVPPPSPVHAVCASCVSSRCPPCAKCVQPPG